MGNCAFCDRTKFEERIIAETDEFFVIATLGQITDGGYTLIFPKRHVRCLSVLSHKEMAQFTLLLLDIGNTTVLEYHIFPAMFEHGIVGQTVEHAHIHLVPARIDLTSRVENDFLKAGRVSFGIFVPGIPRQSSKELQPYLLWRPPERNCWTNIWWNPQNVPAQYFRTILAETLGRPERANWRTMDAELDKRLWSETVLRLKKYF